MPPDSWHETCSCGASLRMETAGWSAFSTQAEKWRTTHKHDMPVEGVSFGPYAPVDLPDENCDD